jgi:uncharacterized Zn finger protein
MGYYDHYYKPYVSAAEKAKKLEKKLKKLTKGGYVLTPVKLPSKVIAKTFWGKAWCENLERYSDLENRLPRGRAYVRNGSVVDLKIGPGSVSAMVNGSSLYDVVVTISPVAAPHWKAIRKDCAGGIDSLVELLQGRLSKAVMERICEPKTGLFPQPAEIKMACSCPDYAGVCKHIAAVIYGTGARLDEQPELLFRLRQVDEKDLIATAEELRIPKSGSGSKKKLASDDLSALFGLEMAGDAPQDPTVAKLGKGKQQRPSKVKVPSKRLHPDSSGAKELVPAATSSTKRSANGKRAVALKRSRSDASGKAPIKSTTKKIAEPKEAPPAAKAKKGTKRRS